MMSKIVVNLPGLCFGLACCAFPQTPSQSALLDNPGDDVSTFNDWLPLRWALAQGTAASPITAAGPLFKISKTENITTSTCGGNQVDNECNAALSVNALQQSTSQMQVSALYAGANGSSAYSTGSPDIVAITGIGRVTGSGVGIGTGAYLDGRRDTATGRAVGLEARVENETTTDGTYNNAGISDTNGIWVTTSSSVNKNSGAAVSVGGIGASKWITGLGFVSGSVVTDSINDNSSSTNSINIQGAHTFAIKTSSAAGAISLGGNVTFPHAIGGKTTASISAGTGAGTSPTVSKLGTDFAGQITVQTGTSPAVNSTIATVTFGSSYGSAPFCVYSPVSAAAAALSGATQVRTGGTATTLVFTSGSAALPSGSYMWNYICGQ